MLRMTIFTGLYFLAVLVENAEFAGLAPKQKYTGWTVLQNPDRERTNQLQSTGICLRLTLPYNNIQLSPEGEVNMGGYIPTRHFSLGSQNSEYPRIFRVTGANQNARKLLSTDLVNTNMIYSQD